MLGEGTNTLYCLEATGSHTFFNGPRRMSTQDLEKFLNLRQRASWPIEKCMTSGFFKTRTKYCELDFSHVSKTCAVFRAQM